MNKVINKSTVVSGAESFPLVEPVRKTEKMNEEFNFKDTLETVEKKLLDFGPRIVVLGKGPSLEGIVSKLETLGANIDIIDKLKDLPKTFRPTLRAIVVVESMGVKSPLRECQKLVRNWKLGDVPVFAVVPDAKDGWSERKLYKTGVQAVFEWPREKVELPRLISRIMDLDTVTEPKETSDGALKSAVRTRLVADSIFHTSNKIAIFAYNGVIMLEGIVKSFARLEAIKKKVSQIPGVRGVMARSVKVSKDEISDEKIGEKVKSILSSYPSLNSEALSVFVKDGVVSLKGPTNNYRAIKNFEKRCLKIAGIRSIQMRVSIASLQRIEDHAAMKKIRKFISDSLDLSSKENIKVIVSSGIASLRGVVENSSLLKQTEKFVRGLDEINDVQNKIAVRA